MDGVLADFESAYHEVEVRLFGPGTSSSAEDPEREEEAESREAEDRDAVRLPSTSLGPGKPDTTAADTTTAIKPDETTDAKAGDTGATEAPTSRQTRRRHDAIWAAIRATPNFWRALKPIDEGAVARIHSLMLQHRWEVFFITQRPATQGDTVQRQTQHWLVEQGFDLPSVLVLGGSRGAAAGALRLNYHVDDSSQNCIDVVSESKARPILIVPGAEDQTVASARRLGIASARSIGECLDTLEEATTVHTQPGLLARIATLVGWK